MSKFNDFFKIIMENSELKAEVAGVLGDEPFEKASDEQLVKIGEIAKKVGFDFTIDEAKEFFSCGELDDDDLDAVAGGKGDTTVVRIIDVVCEIGGGMNG